MIGVTHRMLLILIPVLWIAGCGQWVRYDEDFAPGGTVGTLDDFPEVTRLSHYAFSGLMARFVRESPDGRYVLVDYDAWAADNEALYLLDLFLAGLASTDPADLESPAQRLAYWINGYNASVIRGVLNRYGGDHTFRVIDGPFFDEPLYRFANVVLTLNQVEHGVIRLDTEHAGYRNADGELRQIMKTFHHQIWEGAPPDPRVHAVLNCAALGCPNLPATPPHVYRADTLEEQLADATRAWLDNPEKGAGPDGISQLFDWYRKDFEQTHGSVDAFIDAFRTDGLTGVDTGTFLTYDWTLNIAN